MIKPIDILTEKASVTVDSQEMGLYVARPTDSGTYPAVLVLQEAFGVNEHIQDVCQRFARQGYIAVAPDLFYRRGPWTTITYGLRDKMMEAIQSLTEERVNKDLSATFDFISNLEMVDGDKVGVVGYCLGGRLTYHTATVFPHHIKCAAVYYGGGITKKSEQFPTAPISKTEHIQAPLIGFFGAKDQNIPQEQVESIDQALAQHKVEHEIYYYTEADHGFYNDTRESFHIESAQDAWHRTIKLFNTVLK